MEISTKAYCIYDILKHENYNCSVIKSNKYLQVPESRNKM